MKTYLTFSLLFTLPALALADDLPHRIPTKPLKPTPIRIAIDDLPPPSDTSKVSKNPRIEVLPAEKKDLFLYVPDGFDVTVYATDLDKPRWLAISPEGDLLVTETYEKRIRRLRDTDRDGKVDEVSDFATRANGLNQPFGMAFSEGAFFLGNTDAVRRYDYTKGDGALKGEGVEIAELPAKGYNNHWTRNVVLSPDGQWLFVSVGSEGNVAEEPAPRAAIMRMKLDGSKSSIYASGLRNPIGLGFHPKTGQLYTAVNERDKLGDDLVPDYFTSVKKGAFYGWPYAYLTPGHLDPRMMKDGQSLKPELAKKTVTPDVLYQAHSAVMAVAFPKGEMFPERYRQGAFVPLRGSWNRTEGTGYKITFVPFGADHTPEGYYEDFLTGFLLEKGKPEVWGRPVGAIFLPDGSLVFAEEENGRIYRVSYRGAATPK